MESYSSREIEPVKQSRPTSNDHALEVLPLVSKRMGRPQGKSSEFRYIHCPQIRGFREVRMAFESCCTSGAAAWKLPHVSGAQSTEQKHNACYKAA